MVARRALVSCRMSEVAELEAVCERAWPPRERLAARRARCCASPTASRGAPTRRASTRATATSRALIERAEREYRSRGLRPGFRLTPLTPAAFEPLLRERGYDVDTEAVVMVAEALPETAALAAGDGIELLPALDEEWLRIFQAIERKWPPEQDPGARWVLGSGTAPRRFALAPRRWRSRPRRAMAGSRTTGSTSRRWRRSPSAAASVSRAPSATGSSSGARWRRTARDPPGRDEEHRRAGALREARLRAALHLPRLRARRRRGD